jgi:hypothetical protein
MDRRATVDVAGPIDNTPLGLWCKWREWVRSSDSAIPPLDELWRIQSNPAQDRRITLIAWTRNSLTNLGERR